jgi:hypothetical protein
MLEQTLHVPSGTRLVAQLGQMLICSELDPGVSPGHQQVWFSRQGGGEHFARLLLASRGGSELESPLKVECDERWIRVAHDGPVDVWLFGLMNICVALRTGAPGLVQVNLQLELPLENG